MANLIGTGTFYGNDHPNIYKDWCVGAFIANKDFNTDKCEFKFQRGKKGLLREPKEVLHKETTTLAIIIYGCIRLNFGDDKDYILQDEGDYIIWSPDIPHAFEFMDDSLVITLRWNK